MRNGNEACIADACHRPYDRNDTLVKLCLEFMYMHGIPSYLFYRWTVQTLNRFSYIFLIKANFFLFTQLSKLLVLFTYILKKSSILIMMFSALFSVCCLYDIFQISLFYSIRISHSCFLFCHWVDTQIWRLTVEHRAPNSFTKHL